MKQLHEETSKIEFDKYIRIIFPFSQPVWEEVENDPPDWFLTIDNTLYAVEATTIVELLGLKNNTLSSFSVSASLHNFVKSIESLAVKKGILNGTYIIKLCPIPNFSQHQRQLCKFFLNYIRNTRELPEADEKFDGYVGRNRISIRKLNNNENYVNELIFFDDKEKCEAQKELEQFISHKITHKADKLKHIDEPKILLLLDQYHYSNLADWALAVNSCESRRQFEVICRITLDEPSTVLWSKSPNWIT